MQIINYQDFPEKLSTVIETINNDNKPICLELSNSLRAIILSEQDYNSMIETLYLLSNPVNAEKLLTAVNRSSKEAISWEQVKNNLEL